MIRDPLHWVPVQHKLAILFVSVCLLAFGVGGYLVSSSAERALEREIVERLEFQSRAYAAALDGELRMLSGRIQDFASDGFIRDHLERWIEAHSLGDAPRMREVADELRGHLLHQKLPLVSPFGDLVVATSDGRAVLRGRGEVRAVDQGVAAACAALDGPWFGGLVPAAQGERGPRFAIGTPLRSRVDGSCIGRLLAWVETGPFLAGALRGGELVSTRPVEGRGEGRDPAEPVGLRLVDRSGLILVVPATSSAILERGPASELVREGFGLRLEARTALRGGEPLPRAGVYARSYPIATNGWSAEVELPSGSALAAVSGLQSRFLAVGLILMALTSLLLFFPMRFIARPLRALSATARRLQAGELDARAPVQSSDELGELAHSFNLMAEAVQERTARLESSAADLDARRRELARERDLLGAVIASMRDGLLVLDAEGRVVLHNEAARPLVATLESDPRGATSRHVCNELQGSSDCGACLFDPESLPRSCVVQLGGGVFEIHVTRLARDEQGRAGRVLVCRDLTDRIEKDERQIHQERLAVLGEVAAVMAHELNNPLAAIRMYDQMLRTELPSDSPLLESVDVIERNAVTCSRVVRELLDYATGASPEIAAVDLHALLEDVTGFVRPLRNRAQVELEFDLAPDTIEVTGDEVQLRQIFVNLIVNAIQALPPGGRVRVRTRASADTALVEVEDDGPGIPSDLREVVFRPFYTTKARGEGTGLGLSTSRRIAEMHGGGLELAESSPGRTVFRVRLRRRADVREGAGA